MKRNVFRYLNKSIFLSSLLSTAIFANPVLDNVGAGQVSVSQSSSTTVVNQTSQKAILNWQSFNIGANESTQFQQPTGGIALNRINPSQGASQIYGRLTATGQIILVNPAGIYFAPGSSVNVGGLIASTANISDSDFLNGNYHFVNDPSYHGAIINKGSLIASNNGLIALIGGAVSNEGYIEANVGKVVLGAGNAFTLTFSGNDLVSFTVDQGVSERALDNNGNVLANGVNNVGTISANGGNIIISAKDAAGILDNVINMQGYAQTKSVYTSRGTIILSGDTTRGIVNVGGSIDLSGVIGGDLSITGYHILINGTANINANGTLLGGNVLIGGGMHGAGTLAHAASVVMAPGAIITANATDTGNGGNIVLWSDNYTNVNGSLSATGGVNGGNGGTIETSSHTILNIGDVAVNTLAPNGATGTWLLDPYNITISSSATSGGSFNSGNPDTFTPTATANVSDANINTNLATSNVLITTGGSGSAGADNGDITINNTAAISWSSGTTLTLSAYRNILNDGTITSTSGGALNLIANNAGAYTVGSGFGTVTNTGTFNINGALKIYYNPTAYTAPVTYTNTGAGAVTAYMLVNNVTELQNMNTNVDGNYALSTNIDASATSGWNAGAGFVPVGSSSTAYDGNFDGQNFTISGLYINRPTNPDYTGLFGVTLAATISNLTIANSSITGSWTTGAFVGNSRISTNTNLHNVNTTVDGPSGGLGGIIGYLEASSLSYSSNTGTIGHLNATDFLSDVGGLVGYSDYGASVAGASITNTYNTGSIYGTNEVGGIIGRMNGNPGFVGTISDSYNTGNVTYNNFGSYDIGGIIGAAQDINIARVYNSGTITNDNSTASDSNSQGGLIGYVQSGGSLTDSYNTGTVTLAGGTSGSYLGGLIGQVWGGAGEVYTVTNSYNSGSVITGASVTSSGALIGVTHVADSGGLAITGNSYWDSATSGPANAIGSSTGAFDTGLNPAGFNSITTSNALLMASYSGWNISNTPSATSTAPVSTWFIFEGGTRPMLMMEYNTSISNAHQLQLAGTTLGANYTLQNNLDLSSVFTNAAEVWGTDTGSATGTGFAPISNYTGTFDGNQFSISHLYLNKTSDNVGLFGTLSGAAAVNNLVLNNVVITGANDVGGLVGNNTSGTITNVAVSGSVTATGNNVGGITGINAGTISTSFNSATISGASQVGGIAGVSSGNINTGYNIGLVNGTGSNTGGVIGRLDNGSVMNMFNLGVVSGVTNVGGLVGNINTASATITDTYNAALVLGSAGTSGGLIGVSSGGSTINNSYWDTSTSGQASSAGGTGNTTANMMQQASYNTWDFASTWNIIAGQSYPYLRAFYSATPRIISGSSSAAGNTLITVADNGSVTDSIRTWANGFFYRFYGNNLLTGINDNLADNGILLLYQSGNASVGNAVTFVPGSNGSLSGASALIINAGVLTIGTNSVGNNINNSTLATAAGALVDSGIIYSVNGSNQLSFASGTGFSTAAGTTYTLTGDLTLTNGNISLAGSTILSAASSTISTTGSGTITIADLNGGGNALVISNDDASSAITGVLSNLSAFTKNGTGTMTLSGNNTFNGNVVVNAGTLVASHANALGSVAGGTTIASGSTLNINGVNIGAEALNMNGGTLQGTGIASYGGAITLSADGVINNNSGTLTLSGTIDGANNLTLNGAGTTVFSSAVGATTPLSSITANTNLTVGGITIRTSGNQIYQNTVDVTGNSLFTSIGTGSGTKYITFNGAITGGNDVTLSGTGADDYQFTINSLTANNVTVTGSATGNNTFILNTGGTQTFSINSADGGAISGIGTVAGAFNFSNIQNITGGTGDDIFNFATGASISGTLDGGDTVSHNVISFPSYTGSLSLLLAGTINDGTIYNGGTRIVGFTRIQGSEGNGTSSITLPSVPNMTLTAITNAQLPSYVSLFNLANPVFNPNVNGIIADPFYFFNWTVTNPPTAPTNNTTVGTFFVPPTTQVAAIVNQPQTMASNQSSYNNQINPLSAYTNNWAFVLNETFTSPMLETAKVETGALCLTSY